MQRVFIRKAAQADGKYTGTLAPLLAGVPLTSWLLGLSGQLYPTSPLLKKFVSRRQKTS